LFDTIGKARKYFNPGMKVLGIVINQADGRRPVMEREMEEAMREGMNVNKKNGPITPSQKS